MRSTIARRSFLGRLAALPIFGVGSATFFARRADAATAAIMRQIDEAERRYHDAKQAHDAAHEAFEAAFPKLHWTLDLTQDPRRLCRRIERGFNGSTPKRYVNRFGIPDHRYVATVESLTEDLEATPFRRRRNMIRRMLRRARKHEAAVKRSEEAFRLEDVEADLVDAQQAVHQLAEAVFARHATTLQEIRVQARMLRVFGQAAPEQWGVYQAGLYGTALAANLDQLGAAA